jgi:beta-N-acetylhexosaminidase
LVKRASRVRVTLGVLGLLAISLAMLAGCAAVPEGEWKERSRGEDPEKGAPVRVESMGVRDLVGQMFVVAIGGTEPDYYAEKMIRERNVGGVILFAHNMESAAQTRALVGELQRLSVQTEPPIPLFVAVDQEGGKIGSAPWVTPQPAAARIGARGDAAEARAVAEKIGSELRAAGVNTDLAPVVDTGFGAAIGPRSYGEDPELVARMGAAAIEGFEAARVVSAAKHFPNHGPVTADSHVGLPVVDHDLATVRSFDLVPFEAAVEAGVPMVMTGHLLYPAIDPEKPASLSRRATGMLREELGFDGVVITDDLAMAGAAGGEPPARAAVEAVRAGADLLLVSSPPQQQADTYDAVVAAVESGEIPREQVRASVQRVLRIKGEYPLYRAP